MGYLLRVSFTYDMMMVLDYSIFDLSPGMVLSYFSSLSLPNIKRRWYLTEYIFIKLKVYYLSMGSYLLSWAFNNFLKSNKSKNSTTKLVHFKQSTKNHLSRRSVVKTKKKERETSAIKSRNLKKIRFMPIKALLTD